jgi:hypothetical protein
MIGDIAPRVSNFQGLDLMTSDSGANPLIASYMGAPYQIRGTDPAEYGRAARAYLAQGGGPIGAAIDVGVSAATHAAGAESKWDKIKTGASGAVLGIVVAALGIAYILWGD